MRRVVIPYVPGRKIGVTSDTHYGHRNIIGYCKRPWLYLHTDNRLSEAEGKPYVIPDEVLKAHDDALVERTNAVLGPDDILIHAGDVAWGKDALTEYRRRLDVKTVYVAVGNHDDDDALVEVFGKDYVAERWMFEIHGPGGNRTLVVDHYPGHSWRDSHKACVQLFGHVHGKLDRRHETNAGWLMSADAGVDSRDFRPWLWHEQISPMADSRRAAWQAWRDKTYDTPKEHGGMAR